MVFSIGLKKLLDDNGTLISRVLADGFAWYFASISNNSDTNVLVEVSTFKSGKRL